jgi:hypothetical protein
VAAPRPKGSLPLLASQHLHWVSHQKDPDNPRFNCGAYVHLTGPLRPHVVQAAIAATFAETEAVRVIFHQRGGRPWQRVLDPAFVPLEMVRVSGEEAAVDLMERLLAVPFDLSGGDPPCSHHLMDTGDQTWALFLRYHHIVLDAYGAQRYLLRIAEHYNALLAQVAVAPGRFASLAVLVDEERSYLGSPQARRDEAYWRAVLVPPVPSPGLGARDLPARPRSLSSSVRLPDEVRAGLETLPDRYGVPGPVAVTAATAAHVSRVSGEREVTIGLLAANRTTFAAVKTPADLARELPLRITVLPHAGFGELLRTVSVRMGEALAHQRAPLQHLIRPTALRTYVNLISFGKTPGFAGCRARLHVLSTGPASNFRINCYTEADGRLLLDFEVNPGIYSPEKLTEHQTHVIGLLGTLVSQPEAPLSDAFVPAP